MSHLIELAKQVRATTIDFVEGPPEDWLLWAPPGTSNHILWHAGHALWVQDCLCVEALTGNSELPDEWAEKFGMNCEPVAETREWPSRYELLSLLAAQLDRLVSLFEEHADRLATVGPNTDGKWDLTCGVIHGLHDESRHQGEMYLIIKMCRERDAKT